MVTRAKTPALWIRASLIGVLLVIAMPAIIVFSYLFSRDHEKPSVTLGGGVVTSPMMGRADGAGSGEDSWGSRPQMFPQARMMKEGVSSRGIMATDTFSVAADRKVASTASLDLRVSSIDWTISKTEEIVRGKGGYVENRSINGPQFSERTAWMTVKVPSGEFSSTFEELKKDLYYVMGENLSGVDMTRAVADLDARIANKRAEELTLQDLLKQAVKVSDVIEVTDRLTQVRSEIESLEAEKRSLDNQTELSSISLSMTEDPAIGVDTNDFRDGNIFKKSINELLRALTQLGSGLVLFLIAGIPIVLAYLLFFWIIYFFTKRGVKKFFDR
ncbi:MAG: DUF4349 domain-containing protein [Candidatus Moraniibacteriota bacterium]